MKHMTSSIKNYFVQQTQKHVKTEKKYIIVTTHPIGYKMNIKLTARHAEAHKMLQRL